MKATTTISAMDLRKEPGTILDRVSYRGENFVIERAGEPKAVLVSIQDFAEMNRLREEAKNRLFTQIEKVYKRTAKLNPETVEKTIVEAVRQDRSEKR